MTTRTTFLTVDGTDLRTAYKFEIAQSPAPWERPVSTLSEATLFEKDGAVLLSSEPVVQAADLVFDGTFLCTDADDFETQLTALRRFLGPKGTALHTLVFGNQTSRQVSAYYMGFSGGPTGPQMVQSKVAVQLRFRALDPYDKDTSDTTLGPTAANTPVSIPLGTERCAGTVTIAFSGSAASVTITYKTYGGTTVRSMTLTHAFVNTDSLVIDNDARTISLNGTRNDALLTAGFFIRFDPNDGDGSLSHWPTIETTAGTITVTYRRRW